MNSPETCLIIKRNGVICQAKVQEGLDRCRQHVSSVACPYPLPGDQWCGVELKQAWANMDPNEEPRHPHHRHYESRMIVVPPESRACKVCRTPIANVVGFCDKHDSYAGQARREEVLAELDRITEGDRKEMIKILRDGELLHRKIAELTDLTEYSPITNPYEELYRLAGQTIKWKDILAERVANLEYLGYGTEHTGEQVKAEVQLFTAALAEARTILVSISKLDVEERMVRIAEAQAMMIAEVLGRVLDSLGMDETMVLRARSSVAERLRVFGNQQKAIGV